MTRLNLFEIHYIPTDKLNAKQPIISAMQLCIANTIGGDKLRRKLKKYHFNKISCLIPIRVSGFVFI